LCCMQLRLMKKLRMDGWSLEDSME